MPPIPAKLEAECADPGVGEIGTVEQAVAEIGNQRVYAACSKRKHRDIKLFYKDVKSRFLG